MNMLNLEECELLGDSKYRAYISQVDKALKNFEYTSEWADLISALGKLNKVLSNHVKYPIIPKRVTVGKRLAQCLHPALPSGVHLKALETYDIIFKCIGTARLAGDLFTYSAGIFPLMGHAAMNVKPTLLQLYETHFVPLGKHLKPALSGLLLGVLPGLEEGSEYFDRTVRLLEEFCEATEPTYFYGCLWECVVSSPAIRLAAINFVLGHYNRRQTMEDQLHLMGTNIDLLIEALCASVQDSSVLVQRSALDLLLIGFPMHNSQLTRPDMIKVITAAVKVVLRRDQSLNRRLYAWLLGTDSSGNPLHPVAHSQDSKRSLDRRDSASTLGSELELDYFNTYSVELLITGVKNCIHESPTSDPMSQERPANLKPFRILISLLDKPEIGAAIIEDVLLDIFRCMYKECQVATNSDEGKEEVDFPHNIRFMNSTHFRNRKKEKVKNDDKSTATEIIKTANLLFGAFEPYFIWDFIGRTFEKICDGSNKPGKGEIGLKELCDLVDFLLDKISLETYLEIQTEHLPELLRVITMSLTAHCDQLSDAQFSRSLSLCSKLLSRVLPSINPVHTSDDSSHQGSPVKRPLVFRSDDSILSDSDVFVSADSDTMSTPEHKYTGTEPVLDPGDSSGKSLDENENTKKNGFLLGPDDNQTKSGNADSTYSDSKNSGQDNSQSEDTESFNDFVQYGDNVSDIVTPVKVPSSSRKQLQNQSSVDSQPSLIQTCVTAFQKLFTQFMVSRIVQDADLPTVMLHQLSLTPETPGDQKRMYNRGNVESKSRQVAGWSHDRLSRVKLDGLSKETCDAFAAACQLLVDFSSFPMYCTNHHKLLQASLKAAKDVKLPDWLQLLLTCACFVDNFTIQSSAIATMLDLIGLTQSVMEMSKNEGEGQEDRRPSASDGTVSVVIIPSLMPNHLQYINQHTHFYRVLAVNLWGYLGDNTHQCHVRTVDLLFQLHQLCPDPWVCEDVIGNSLLSNDKTTRIGACKRFSILWHLLRDKIASYSSQGHRVRTFDRSMFVMLDSLQSDTHPCKAITQTWLTHTIQRGDVARVLEPILLILLHPDTARISIQHVNIHQPKKIRLVSDTSDNQSECSEAKIYAISSEGGNVIYHVSHSGKNISKRTSDELRSLAMTTISDGQTETAAPNLEQELHFNKVDPTDLNLRINPFGSQHSLDRIIFDGFELPNIGPALAFTRAAQKENFPDLQNIRRLDAQTCKKEGIFFDGRELSDDEQEKEEERKDEGEITPTDTGVDTSHVSAAEEVTEDSHRVQTPPNSVKDESHQNSTCSTPERLVRDLLDEIVDTVVTSDSESMENPLEGSSETVIYPRQRLMSMASSTGGDEIFYMERRKGSIDSQSESEIDGVSGGLTHRDEVPTVHPLHTHILLYSQKYDSQRTLYALTCLKSILSATPRLITCSLSTTSLNNANTPHLAQLQNLLIRHRRSVFGKSFFHEVQGDVQGSFRSAMLIEILISVCLYFIRSYYPNLMMSKMTEQELSGNKEVQILSCEILMLILSELVTVAKDSGRGFSTYISDLLARCKVQKTLLHCVLASVYNSRQRSNSSDDINSFTDTLINFNEEHMDMNTNETFQVKLLNLILVVIILEDEIRKAKSDTEMLSPLPTDWEKIKLNAQPALSTVRFIHSRPVVYQGMLLSAVLVALKQQHLTHMHRHWIAMVTSAMPFLFRALSHSVVTVVNQICRNIELLAQLYEHGEIRKTSSNQPSNVPPDHLVTVLEAMTTMCHYCLLDNVQQDVSVGQAMHGNTNLMADPANSGHILGSLISVFNPYSNTREPSPAKDAVPTINPVLESRRHLLNILPRVVASLADLWKATRVSEKGVPGKTDKPCWAMGRPKMIRKYILEFLSPISKHHGVNLMASVAIVWNDRRQRGHCNSKRHEFISASVSMINCRDNRDDDRITDREFLNRIVGTIMPPSRCHLVLPQAGEDQLLLVDLISAVKVLPTDTLIQMVKSVLKQPPAPTADKNKKRTPVEVSLLQFFYAYLQHTSSSQLVDTWPQLLSLLKDGLTLNLTPPGIFLLIVLLNEFVQKLPGMFEDRKDQKDLQEITQKLLEACSEIAGSSLEQTTFFRRNLAVKPGPQVDVTAVDNDDVMTDQEMEVESPPPAAPPQPKLTQEANRQYSVQALVILAELTAGLLDIVYRSEEKDRVVPLLSTIMNNMFPYLKNHSAHNLPSFRACCQMLGSLSSYQYTRKAWKREAFEMLMDISFFQMDELCIPYWRVIIDNLMTHDKTSFRDLLARVTVTQGAALNLFSSKEAEFEQKALLLKRMSFVIFCSEVDQYQRTMPEIQERLADSLRMPTVPSLQAQVFMCFRVLLLRISPQHMTSLWPTIITELIHVLLQIEQELTPEIEETNFLHKRKNRSHTVRSNNVDPSWALGNGLNAKTNPGWLKLYLAACKLLDLALVLPAEQLPQFQLYRWAFTGDPGGAPTEPEHRHHKELQPHFVPHVIRLARLMNLKFGETAMLPRVTGRPLLTISHIKSLRDLHSFFHTVSSLAQSFEDLLSTTAHQDKPHRTMPKSISTPELHQIDSTKTLNHLRIQRARVAQLEIEQVIEWDFLEPLPKK